MKLVWVFLLTFPLVAENIPGRYVVELSTEPVARHVRGQGRLGMLSPAALRQRAQVRSEQAGARGRVVQAEGAVSAAVENVANALVVEIDDAKADRLAAMPGVRRVYPVRTIHMMLDHALPLHKAQLALAQAGIENAGAGVRIAIIDSGVDVRHPGFQDGGFTAPEGFPRGELDYTNNKVIVSRTYVATLEPDGADRVGHGTATAMAAAGVSSVGPLATVGGMAPRAYVGSYKVFGTGTSTSSDMVLRAIDDAVADGMDIINLSLGTDIAKRLEDDPEAQAIENASALGIIVVCAAGNNGSEPMTVGSPAGAPSAIAVGATGNDRVFSARVIAPEGRTFRAAPGSSSGDAAPVTGRLVDTTPLDGDGLGCNAMAAGSLDGAVALISRGTCTFEVKLNSAAAAGAVAAVVYNNVEGALVTMGMGTATLPAELVSLADGGLLRELAAAGIEVTLEFSRGPVYIDPQRLESFSAAGPHVEFGIKPDLVAVGGSLYTATQSLDPRGAMYNANGFTLTQGTSFSAPIVAGAAAVVKSARPGLTAAQYRSLLVNTAEPAWSEPGTRAGVQRAGAGNLDLLAAVSSTAAAAPVSLSFGVSAGTFLLMRELTVWNVGTAADTFTLSVAPLRGNAVPELGVASVELEPGASATVPVSFGGEGLGPGEYEGAIEIRGSMSTAAIRTPYWHGVASGRPRNVTIVWTRTTAGAAGSTVSDAVLFRVTDEAGVPVAELPSIQPIAGGGDFAGLRVLGNSPFAYSVSFRLGPRPGENVFRIQAGDVSRDVTVIGQ
jgi:subtilisin family serine protease